MTGEKILELDLGNSRIKWRLLRDEKVAHFGVRSYQEGLFADLEDAKVGLTDSCLARIRVASVVDAERQYMALEPCRRYCTREPELARVQPQCAGVTQAYEDISHLGVDRWLALLAVFNRFAKDCVVVSCGTAVTVDLLAGNGEHQGGYIVPGLETMRQSLADRTHSVKVNRLESVEQLMPGRDTVPAVHRGLLLMLVALIDNARGQLGSAVTNVPVIATGGDAKLLQPHLRGEIIVEDQLVLDGLRWALP